ncbi:MAG: hypothetical protein HY961_05560 [Ignavibacteriae bacterium]|nr:hypothetical protein [Ignavibacteriota bacterium]
MASAYAGNGGSAYTSFGIGDLRFFPSTRSAGMGYTGIGVPSSIHVNSLVPASWTRLNRVRVEAGGLYEGINTAEANKSLYQARGLFNGVSIAIPISQTHGIVFVGGFAPYSFSAYNTSFENAQDSVAYSINEIGSGGLTRAHLGLSYVPLDDLSVGASLNYLFGTMKVQRQFIPGNTGGSGGTLFIDEIDRGVNLTLSGMYNGFGNIAEPLRPLSLGFLITTQANMSMDLNNRLTTDAYTDTVSEQAKRFTIPLAYGFGAAYQFGDRWIVAADYSAQLWGNAKFDGQPFTDIRNSSRFGIGAEKLPLRDATRWLDRVAYRVGFSYNATYYKIFGEPINEWSVTGGFTFPLVGENRLNVGIEYGERGIKKNVLVKDNIVRVSMSLTIAEPWFIRMEEE